MKKLLLLLSIVVLSFSCDSAVGSKWTDLEKDKFIKEFAFNDIEKFVVAELISDYENTTKSDSLAKFIKTEKYITFYNEAINYFVINIDKIAGQTEEKVAMIVGEANEKETVNPSKVGLSVKKTYLNGLLEIVFIDELADWITVNSRAGVAGSEGKTYISVQYFDNYIYAKYKTQ